MIARALLGSLAVAAFAFACTQPPPANPPTPTEPATPTVASPESPTGTPTAAPSSVPTGASTGAPAPSGKPCIQNVMCMKGTHFDRTVCRCMCDEGNAACLDAGAK